MIPKHIMVLWLRGLALSILIYILWMGGLYLLIGNAGSHLTTPAFFSVAFRSFLRSSCGGVCSEHVSFLNGFNDILNILFVQNLMTF